MLTFGGVKTIPGRAEGEYLVTFLVDVFKKPLRLLRNWRAQMAEPMAFKYIALIYIYKFVMTGLIAVDKV